VAIAGGFSIQVRERIHGLLGETRRFDVRGTGDDDETLGATMSAVYGFDGGYRRFAPLAGNNSGFLV